MKNFLSNQFYNFAAIESWYLFLHNLVDPVSMAIILILQLFISDGFKEVLVVSNSNESWFSFQSFLSIGKKVFKLFRKWFGFV